MANSITEMLELIVTRSSKATNEAIVLLFAILKRSPIDPDRYGRMLQVTLADEGAQWNEAERKMLLELWEDSVDEHTTRTHCIRLGNAAWERAKLIGSGSATSGIQIALREYRSLFQPEGSRTIPG
jgi:hypothetical protein